MSRFLTRSLLLGVLLLTGCVLMRQDNFSYVHDAGHKAGAFVPQTYIDENRIDDGLLLFWVYNDVLPHDVAMAFHADEETRDQFESVVIESLQLQHTGERPSDLVPPTFSLEQRTHKLSEQKIEFRGAITKRASFTLSLRGYAVDKQGQRHPFEKREAYEFKGSRWILAPLLDA